MVHKDWKSVKSNILNRTLWLSYLNMMHSVSAQSVSSSLIFVLISQSFLRHCWLCNSQHLFAPYSITTASTGTVSFSLRSWGANAHSSCQRLGYELKSFPVMHMYKAWLLPPTLFEVQSIWQLQSSNIFSSSISSWRRCWNFFSWIFPLYCYTNINLLVVKSLHEGNLTTWTEKMGQPSILVS